MNPTPPSTHQAGLGRLSRRIAATVGALALAAFALLPASHAQTFTWTRSNTASMSWGDTVNWQDGAVADGVGAIANFTVIQGGVSRTVNVNDADRTVGVLNLLNQHVTAANNQSYTFASASGNVLKFDNGASVAELNITNGPSTGGGNNTFSVGIQLGSSLNIANNRTLATNTLVLSGPISAFSAGNKVLSNVGTAPAQVTISGIISDGAGTVGVRQASADGVLLLSGINTYTGGTRIDAGRITVSEDANLGDYSSTVTFNGGELRNTATINVTGANQRNYVIEDGGGAFNVNSATFMHVRGTISGTGALIKDGGGTLALYAAGNTYAGGTLIKQGTLRIGAGSDLGTGNLTFEGGTLSTNANSISVGATQEMVLNSNATINTTNAGHTLTWNGDVSGSGTLIKNGDGTLVLKGANNSYVGGTVVNAGTLSVDSDHQLGAAGTSVTLNSGTTLSVTGGGNFNNASSERELAIAGNATVNTAAFANWYGAVTGSGLLTKTGSSTLSLNNANSTHTGGIQVNQGTLRTRAGDSALGAANNSLTFANGTTFLVQHLTSSTVTEINAARTATLSSGNVTFDIRTAAVWNGALTGAGGLSKIGTAQFTLNSVADYTGTTAVSVGTFALGANGGLASSQISIADGANFDVSARTGGFRLATGQNLAVAGTGLFTGTLGVGSDTTAETITLSDNLNLASGAGLLFDLGATGDQLAVTGNVSAAGNVSVHLNFLAGFTTGTYTLMSAALITDPGLFVLDEGGLLEGYHYNLLTSGSSLQLAVTAIPEPSTYALLAGVLTLGLAAWRRSRGVRA